MPLEPAVAAFNEVLAFQRSGDLVRAEAVCERLSLEFPAFADAWHLRGLLAFQRAEYLAGIPLVERSLELNPLQPAALDLAETLANRGGALLDLNELDQALHCYEAALRIRPDLASALDSQALALLYADRPAEAVRSYSRLAAVAPAYRFALSNLAFTRSLCCDWSQYDGDCAAVIESVTLGGLVQPLQLLSISQSPALHLECARRFMEASFGSAQNLAGAYAHDQLRIAYVSADLRQHPIAHLMAGIFEQHDRERVETIAVALQPEDTGALGQRLRKSFDRFIDVTRRSDRETALLMRELEVDIAVDLTGLTRWSRPGIFVYRAAPVQVNYLGYAGTLGSSAWDYLLADSVVIPAAEQPWYSEQIVHLPQSYLPNDSKRVMAPRPPRSAAGLPETGFIFCAFTSAFKINPAIFDVWMRLLYRVPGSVLWLRSLGPDVRGNLRHEAQKRGVSPERLIFAPHIPEMARHLSRQSLADLYLDTVPYNAHSTACDALWAGVPVVTCMGQSFASRGAASALMAVGLPELIAHSIEEYETLALDLALRREMLCSMRTRLEENRRAAPLFDTARTCRELEAAYLVMHRRAARGEAPAGFAVASHRPG